MAGAWLKRCGKKRSRPAVKAGLSDRQKHLVATAYGRIADSWEPKYSEVTGRQFRRERKRLLAVLEKEQQRKQAPVVNWDEIAIAWEQIYAQAGDEWRSAFVPLMQGTIEDQVTYYSAAFGMSFDVRLLYAEAWFDEYVMTFASEVIGSSERELAGLLQAAQREGWSIPEMQKNMGLLFDQWIKGNVSAETFSWIEERMPAWRRELIARTETIRSSSAGIDRLMGQWNVKYKEWYVTHDNRTCPWCMSMNGKVIPVGGTYFEQGSKMTLQIGDKLRSMTFNYGKVDFPPLHCNCRCCLLPVMES